jgi:hypothetical protein
MKTEYRVPPATEFKYEFDEESNSHLWYDDKIHGTVFYYNPSFRSKDESFEHLKKEVGKMRGEWIYIKEALMYLIDNDATIEEIRLYINRL